jgi:hypothetical protein
MAAAKQAYVAPSKVVVLDAFKEKEKGYYPNSLFFW